MAGARMRAAVATAFLGSNPRLEGFGDPRSQSRNLGHPIFDGVD